MSSQPESIGNTTPIKGLTGQVSFQDLFDKQKAYFNSDVTKTYEWRIDQLDRLIRMLKENDKRFSEASRRDFRTALQENIFEVAASIGSIELMKSQIKDWSSYPEVPHCLGAQGNRVPRTLWCYADHVPIQRATCAVVASGCHCSFGG